MKTDLERSKIHEQIRRFVKKGFRPSFDQLKPTFPSNAIWRRLRRLGSELWLDTGSIDDAEQLWTQEFSALTTNNTLLNKEVQTGRYDSLIVETAKLLASFGQLDEREQILEITFVLNAWHGLRLVEKFDAYVSVEEHTDLADDVQGTIEYARRYHAICPERFIIKIPFTPAGLLATRRLSAEGIPVNHTLGFSARQNYLMARIAGPMYLNVFLGRLNSFVADNGLGDGTYVGEKATIASQAAIRRLRQQGLSPSLQIGASFRQPSQVRDLAGIDVMTMPPKVAAGFLDMNPEPDQITDRSTFQYQPGLNQGIEITAIRLDTLWEINQELVSCIEALERENIDAFSPDDLIDFFKKHNCSDVLVRWSDSEIQTSRAEGKIPQLQNWREALAEKSIGLDSLMNLAGLNSFAKDQEAMDNRVRQVLSTSQQGQNNRARA